MLKSALICIVLMSLISSLAFATLPGQDINASASITSCQMKQLDTFASITYLDPSGNAGQESPSTLASVFVETSLPTATAGPVIAFVQPAANARVFFTTVRSLLTSPALVGKCVKVAGRIGIIGSACYLDDGSTITASDATIERPAGTPLPVTVRTDLLTSMPVDGTMVMIQGICRQESDGQYSLLPLKDSAIVRVQ